MGTKVNLVIDQGSTFSTTINLTDDDGDLVNLTGFAGAGQIRKHYTSSTSTAINVGLGGSNGTVTLALSANSTANIVAGRYVYDVEITSPSGEVTRIFEGIVTVTPQVTR
jgi:hypothetical protein